jgi:hypothetical protein
VRGAVLQIAFILMRWGYEPDHAGRDHDASSSTLEQGRGIRSIQNMLIMSGSISTRSQSASSLVHGL